MNLMVNPVITDFQQDVNGDIKMLKLGANKEDAYENIIEQGADAKLEKNKTATINVSTYTEPVVINPTSGKDGMKKATITLSNIPSGGSATAYKWGRAYFLEIETSPNQDTTIEQIYAIKLFDSVSGSVKTIGDIKSQLPYKSWTRESDTKFYITYDDDGDDYNKTFERDSSGDFTLWELSE